MTIGVIFFSIAILGIVGLFVAKPLLQPRINRRGRISRYDRLQVQKEALLIRIRDLDFDYETGKLTEADYQHQRSEIMAKATSILMQMDKLDARSPISESVSAQRESVKTTSDIDAEIEAAVAQIRTSVDTTERMNNKQESQEKNPSQDPKNERIICAQCGHAADYGDKYCSICGHALKQPQRA
jgi:hypothetical protein